MFTGIIEHLATIKEIIKDKGNISIWLQSPINHELKIDQSLSHNGICLTVDMLTENSHRVTAVAETINKTTIEHWQVNDSINLERCLQMNGRLDGHIVQGHVDATAICKTVVEKNGSWEYTFEYSTLFAHLIIEKGSICINGISLTAFNVTGTTFTVAIIPYTYEHTTMQYIGAEMAVNVEFDIVGKYIGRMAELKN